MNDRGKEHKIDELEAPVVELTPGEADRVTGGLANSGGTDGAADAIVSPRDPASGLPTGKRL